MAEALLLAFGVLLGAALSVGTTALFQWEERRRARGDLASALLAELLPARERGASSKEAIELVITAFGEGRIAGKALLRLYGHADITAGFPVFFSSADRLHHLPRQLASDLIALHGARYALQAKTQVLFYDEEEEFASMRKMSADWLIRHLEEIRSRTDEVIAELQKIAPNLPEVIPQGSENTPSQTADPEAQTL